MPSCIHKAKFLLNNGRRILPILIIIFKAYYSLWMLAIVCLGSGSSSLLCLSFYELQDFILWCVLQLMLLSFIFSDKLLTFCTVELSRYTKALEVIKKLHKDQAQEIKTYKLKLENLQTLKDSAYKVLIFFPFALFRSLYFNFFELLFLWFSFLVDPSGSS